MRDQIWLKVDRCCLATIVISIIRLLMGTRLSVMEVLKADGVETTLYLMGLAITDRLDLWLT